MPNKQPVIYPSAGLILFNLIELFLCTFYRIALGKNFHRKSNTLTITGYNKICNIKR